MAEPPGQVLSSLASSSDTSHSKLAGCAGAFFHLFDWNHRLNGKRLFRYKLLPAERPKQVSKIRNDEKLPMAKLLLIADENRGGFPTSPQNESGEAVPKEETSEIIVSNRTPGVVARLMGLETMPCPELPRETKEHETNRFGLEEGPSQDLLHNRLEIVGNGDRIAHSEKSRSAPFKQKAIRLDRKPLEKYPGRRSCTISIKDAVRSSTSKNHEDPDASTPGILVRRVPDRFHDPEPRFFARLPPLPPQQAGSAMRSVLSPSKSHNKSVSPIKTPMASKSTARLFQAAAKILEPSMQSTSFSTNFGIQSRVSGLGFTDGEEKGGKNETSAPMCPKRMSRNSASSSKGQLSKSPSETSPDQKKRRVEQGSSSPRLWHTSADQAFGSRQDGVMHPAKTQVSVMQEKKPGDAGDLRRVHRNGKEHASKQHVDNRRGPHVSLSQEALRRSRSVREEVPSGKRLSRSVSVKEERAFAKCNHGLQELRQARAGIDVRPKPDFWKQEQTSRRRSQPAAVSNQNFKRSGAKQDSDPSSPKERVVQSENLRVISPKLSHISANGGESSQSSNSLVAQVSSESVASSVSSNSASIGSVNHSRFFGSRKDEAQGMHNEGSTWMEMAQRKGVPSLMRSLLRRRAETEMMASNAQYPTAEQSSKLESMTVSEYPAATLLDGSLTIDESLESRYGATEHSSYNNDESSVEYESQEVVVTQSEGHRNDVESASCSHSSLEYVSDFVRNPDFHAGTNIEENGIRTERVRARWGTCDSSALEASISESAVKSTDVLNVENSNRSCCDFSFGNFRDTSSSRVHPDVGSARRESVSYSGKTTAAILQELLVALNSSRRQLTLEEKAGDKSGDSRITGTDKSSESAMSRLPERKMVCNSGTTEYATEHACHSADSVAVLDSLLEKTVGMSSAFKEFSHEGGSPLEECESVSDSLCTEECGQPSPVSILESPFQYESSNSSDSFESTQERKHREGDGNEHFECTSTIGSLTEDGDSAERSGFGDCDELMDTISRLHHIDLSFIALSAKAKRVSESEEQYVKEILGAAKFSPEDVYSGQLQLSASSIDQTVFNKLEEQVQRWEWGICCPEEDDADSTCRSEMESYYEEAALLNRKLIFDCISDALRSIFLVGKQLSGLCSQPLLHSRATYLSRSVYRQIDEWKGTACSMNVDTMVEKEMNTVTGSWCEFCSEVSEVAVDLERDIFRGLIEELVIDMSKSFCKERTKWVSVRLGGPYLSTKTVN